MHWIGEILFLSTTLNCAMIYYVYPNLSSFVRNDISELGKTEKVIHQSLNWANKKATPFLFIVQACHLFWFIWRTDAIIISFAGYHSFLPVVFAKIWHKKVVIILNGTDSVGIRELNYGLHLKKLVGWFCKFSLNHADQLWPVSKELIEGSNDFTGIHLKYGVHISFPSIQTPYVVIPNGFDLEKWPLTSVERMPKSVVTVVSGSSQFELKGIDLLVAFIQAYPEFQLTIVGMNQPDAFEGHERIRFLGKLPQQELSTIFNSHCYYAQLSSFEGFGCSLCEAMLSGCIPIGSTVNAIPEIIQNSGVIITKKTVEALAIGITELEQNPSDLTLKSATAREVISARYTLAKRIVAMKKALNKKGPLLEK
jgi:glycosyltransferase involved in cell wall biosynthesis